MPPATVTKYNPSFANTSRILSISISFERIRKNTPIGVNMMTHRVTFIITILSSLKTFNKLLDWDFVELMAMPKMMLATTKPIMFMPSVYWPVIFQLLMSGSELLTRTV